MLFWLNYWMDCHGVWLRCPQEEIPSCPLEEKLAFAHPEVEQRPHHHLPRSFGVQVDAIGKQKEDSLVSIYNPTWIPHRYFS